MVVGELLDLNRPLLWCLSVAGFISLSCLSACSAERSSSPAAMSESNTSWKASDLFAGPTEIIKSPFTVLTCPLRLSNKEITGISNSNAETLVLVGDSLLLPFRAVIDGAFSGVGYLVGGAIDTATAGSLGVVGGATGEEEPNGTIHCVLSGTYE